MIVNSSVTKSIEQAKPNNKTDPNVNTNDKWKAQLKQERHNN